MKSLANRLRHGLITVVAGILVMLALAEISLQIASTFSKDRSDSTGSQQGKFRVLALGDSHTYGAKVEQAESYPARLQTILDDRVPATFAVTNKGIPGFGTAQVRSRLAGHVAAYEPHLVLLWVGINDVWNGTETFDTEISWRERLDGYASRLRLYKMLRVWRHDRHLESGFPDLALDNHGPRPQIEVNSRLDRRIDWGDGVVEHVHIEVHDRQADAVHGERVERNLDAVISSLAARGICAALIEYPLQITDFGTANQAMRRLAARHDIPIIHSRASVNRLPRDQREYLWALHPNAAMYDEIAKDVAVEVLKLREHCM